jgi:hypothetical protein
VQKKLVFEYFFTEKSCVNGPLSSNSGSEVLGEENENYRERNTAFPLKTPASIYLKKMG